MEQTQDHEGFSLPERDTKGVSSDVEPQNTFDGDENQLARLGKKQVLKVRDQHQKFLQSPC